MTDRLTDSIPIVKWLTITVVVVTTFLFFSCNLGERSYGEVNRRLSEAISIEDSDAVSALNLYEEALDELLGEPDSSMLRETYFRMGLLFMRWSLPEECVASVQQAFVIDSMRGDTLSMVKSLRSIAFAYESSGQLEKARRVASHELGEDVNTKNSTLKRLNYDSYSRYVDMQEMQRELPMVYLDEMSHITPISSELELAYLAWLAERDQNTSEAIKRYRQLSETRSHYVRGFAQLHLSRLLLVAGQVAEANETLDRYEETNALIRKGEQTTKRLLQLHARYQDARSKKQIGRLEVLNHRQWFMLVSGAVVCSLLIGVLLLWIRVSSQRQQILKFRIDKLRQWREEYLHQDNEVRKSSAQTAQQTDIYQKVRLKLNGGDSATMNDDDWRVLESTVLRVYPHFRQRLFELCRLSDHDYRVCMLLKIGIRPSEIARLTIRSDEAITSTRRRLYERAFGKKGKPTDWDEVVKTL